MNKLSVVLATFNEENNLSRCLTSIQDVADEIIVVDGHSTDQTPIIARRFKATLISTSNKSNFHINKQMAIDKAKYPLILQLDADEVVDDQLRNFILDLKKKDLTDQPSAWYIRRKNFFINKFLRKGGQYPDPVIRLFQKNQATLPQKDVHEQMAVVGKLETAPGHLLHYSNPDFATYMKKFNTYTSFAAHKLVENNFYPGPNLAIKYFLLKPIQTFFALAIRHKGLLDGLPGLLFALMSAWHHPITYLKAVELINHHENTV